MIIRNMGGIARLAFNLSGLADPISQFLIRRHRFSELVLARIIGPAHVSKPLTSREIGKLWRKKCIGAYWTFPFHLTRNSFFGRPTRTVSREQVTDFTLGVACDLCISETDHTTQ